MTNLQKIESEIESEVQQKLQKLKSEVRQKLNADTIGEHEDLDRLLIREWLPAERQPKVDAILTEYRREWAAIVAEGKARRANERNRTQKQDCPGEIGRPT